LSFYPEKERKRKVKLIVNGSPHCLLIALCVVPSVPAHRRVFGDNLRSYRKRANLTQEKLAEKAGLSVIFVSLLENGWRTASMDSLLRIAKALNVELSDLVRGVK
jgi:DNA-binding XRE family transcriptional regulator